MLIATLILMLAILAVFVTIFISGIISGIHGAPYVPIKKKLVKNLLEFGGVSANDIFYDLGCGDGRVLLSAVKEFGIQKTSGYEISLWPYLESKFLIWQTGINKYAKVYRQDFFKADLSCATFIYMYLFPKLVNELAVKIAKECDSGTKILCPSFQIELQKNPEFRLLKAEKIGKITAYLYEKI
jgi:hypothetical protein